MEKLGEKDQLVLAMILVVTMAAVLVIDALLLVVWLWVRDDVVAGRRKSPFAPSWSLVDPWIGGQIAFGTLTGVAAFVGMIATATSRGAGHIMDAGFLVTTLIVQNALLAAVPLHYLTFRYRLPVSAIGLAWPPRRRHLAIGVVWGLLMLLAGAALEAATRSLARFVVPTHVLRVLESLSGLTDASAIIATLHGSWIMLGLVCVGVAVAVPLGEELFFRGFVHNCARRRLGPLFGSLVSAGAFALVHANPMTLPAVFAMGIMMAVAYDRSGSLWVPIVMHGVNNGMLTLVLLAGWGKAS